MQLDVGNGETVLRSVFLSDGKVGEFPTIPYQIPKLANICRRNKAARNQVVLEDVCNPFGIPLVGFLAPNCFHILGVSKNNITGGLKDVVNRNPIFPGRFHAHILAVIPAEPSSTPPQIAGESGEPLAFVGSHALRIGRGNTCNNKRFVDIHPAADGVNDFKHNTSPQNSI